MCNIEFPHFGTSYPDAHCIDGYLWDMDSYENGCYTIGGDDPCPFCNTEAWLKTVLGNEEFASRKEALEWVEKMREKWGAEHRGSSEIPKDLEEAAKEYAKTTFKKPHSDNPDEEFTIVEPDKYVGFIAGARYEDEQLSEKIAAAYQLGLADKEKQMMSSAVEGWVAVDSDIYDKRRVTFFPQKPIRDVLTEYKYWAATRPRYESIKLDSNAFPSLKWEDEPKKVKLIIIKED